MPDLYLEARPCRTTTATPSQPTLAIASNQTATIAVRTADPTSASSPLRPRHQDCCSRIPRSRRRSERPCTTRLERCSSFVAGEVLASSSRAVRRASCVFGMIGNASVPQPGTAFVVARVGGEDVRLARATAKNVRTSLCTTRAVDNSPAGWLVITLRPPSGIGVR